MDKKRRVFLRHFAVQHPLFRADRSTTGIRWDQSVYYLWWEYLRRNVGYKLTCERGGKGKFARLYADFGNVHAADFRKWWTEGDRGARLFAEPSIPQDVTALSPTDLESLTQGWDEKSFIVIAVPLTPRRRHLEQRFRALLGEHHRGKSGHQLLRASRALYPITHQFNFNALKLALDVHDYRRNNPKARLWEISQSLAVTTSLSQAELNEARGDQSPSAIEKKNVMSVAVSRKLRQASAIIDSVGRGKFPGPH